MICHALNGLTGAVDNVGGTLKANKEYTTKFPEPDDYHGRDRQKGQKTRKDRPSRPPANSRALNKGKSGGGVVTNNAADGILNDDPNEIKVAIAYMNNFTFSCGQPERWERALSKIPFVVHITTNASEFTWFSDILLPNTHHMFEKYGYAKSHGNGYRHVTIMQPIIKNVWDYKTDETEIPWLIAEKLAERGFDNLLRHFKAYIDPETGKEPTNEKEFALYALKYATQNLWDPAKHKGGDKFNGWEEFPRSASGTPIRIPTANDGARWKPRPACSSSTAKPSKRPWKNTLKNTTPPWTRSWRLTYYEARGERAFVPHYEEPYIEGDAKEFPFIFVDYKSRLNREGRSANCGWYYEFKDLDPGDEAWDDVAKINPLDAEKLGIQIRRQDQIISPIGKIECTAKLWEGVRPGTVAKCYGQGHWVYGRLAAKEFGKTPRGGNNNDLIPAVYERLSGSTVRHAGVRVKIEKT